jgi:hypothetical protein
MIKPPDLSAQIGVDSKVDSTTVRLVDEVRRINAIRLVGAPRTVVLDEGALTGPDGDVPEGLLAKISYLASSEDVRFVVLMDSQSLPRTLASVVHLEAQPSLPDPLDGNAMVISFAEQPVGGDSWAWHVGNGPAPHGMRPCRYRGGEGTDVILGLYGSGLIQEKAGAAFRAAGMGQEPPAEHPYDRESVLGGISRAVALPGSDEADPPSVPPQRAEFDGESRTLIRQAFGAIELACAPSGAIAAAPPRRTRDDPDYWFFWQRDAGQVAVCLASQGLSTVDPTVAEGTRRILERYVSFVAGIPHAGPRSADLTVSRFTVDGLPVVTYGSPQNDGPAHTALALLAAVGPHDAGQALKLAKPYLDLLVRLAAGANTYDAWEFAVGRIFSTENLIRRALRQGQLLATRIRDQELAEEYGRAAAEAQRQLADFYDARTGYIRAGRDYITGWLNAMSGLDCSVVGSILVAYDVTDDFMNVDDPRVVRTMDALESRFADRWTVNRRWKARGQEGLGFGRFPEDTNDGIGSTGGHHWEDASRWAAQYPFRLIHRMAHRGDESGQTRSKDQLFARAEGTLQFVLAHTGVEAIAEQIDGQTGEPRGADKMAWAHAELINTLLIRDSVLAECF